MSVTIRERRDDDIPALAVVLAEQQAGTQYPVRWPLPFPVEDFLVRPGEERAWVAEVDGRVVGHVAVYALAGDLRESFVTAIGSDELAELAVLFVGSDVIGTGIGGRLHDTAVEWIVASGRQPVLDVVPVHDRAVEVYRHRGWQVVGEVQPAWLAADFPTLVLMTLNALVPEDRRSALLARGRGLLEVAGEHPQVELPDPLRRQVGLQRGGRDAGVQRLLRQLDARLGEARDPLPDLDRGADDVGARDDTSPIRSASSARTSRPVSMMSAARVDPTARGSRNDSPSSLAVSPLLIPAARKYAAGAAIRRSQASARQRPPPIAAPLTAAITGWCRRRIVSTTSSSTSIARSAYVGRVSPATPGGTPADSWSAPEQKPLPAPVTTTARTVLSSPSERRASRKGTITSYAIAFIRSGRFRVTTATAGSGRSTSTNDMRAPYCRLAH